MKKPDLGIEKTEGDLNDYCVDRLILVQMLTCMSKELMQEVMTELRREGRFRYSLKNTLNNMQRECREMLGNFFGMIGADGTDEFVDSYDILDKNVRAIAGLKTLDDIFDASKPTLTQLFNTQWYAGNTRPPMVDDIIAWTIQNHKRYSDRYVK